MPDLCHRNPTVYTELLGPMPEDKWTNESGWADFWAPPRGYVVYVPKS